MDQHFSPGANPGDTRRTYLRIRRIRATPRFREAKHEHAFPCRQIRQVRALLVLAPAQLQRFDAQTRRRPRRNSHTLAVIAEGQAHQHQIYLRATLPTVLLCDRETEEAQIGDGSIAFSGSRQCWRSQVRSSGAISLSANSHTA